MTVTTRVVGSGHVRSLALALAVGSLVVLAQAWQADGRSAVALGGAGVLAATASVRLWRQRLAITTDGLVDRRLLRDRRLPWLAISDFYLGRPSVAGGICVWVVEIGGEEYSLRSTWTTDRRDDLLATEKLINELRANVGAHRRELQATFRLQSWPTAEHPQLPMQSASQPAPEPTKTGAAVATRGAITYAAETMRWATAAAGLQRVVARVRPAPGTLFALVEVGAASTDARGDARPQLTGATAGRAVRTVPVLRATRAPFKGRPRRR